MAEFFVALKARRLGVGRDAAQLIFNRFAGAWEVSEFLYNRPAVTFWRTIVAEYTGGKFRETADARRSAPGLPVRRRARRAPLDA